MSLSCRPLRLALVTFFLLAGLSAGITHAQTPAAGIAWAACDAALPELECGSIAVPLDYADPAGPQISIGFNRLAARDSANRIGALIFNPGGPGSSASQLVAAAAAGLPIFPDKLRDRFDIIGMDPRGVGTSTPVQCDPAIYNQDVSRFPTNEAEFDALVAYNTALGESCLAMTGPLLGHIDTVSAARDIEAVRIALGDAPLNYLGLSYGTELGAQYASLYPENIRVMALDGALEHNISDFTMLSDEASAYERAFDRFIAWCAADTACVLHGQNVGAIFDELLSQAAIAPLPAPACANGTAPVPCRATVRPEDLRINTQQYLLFPEPYPIFGLDGRNGLAAAIKTAAEGDASQFSSPVATSPTDSLYVFGPAITCLDFPTTTTTYAEYTELQQLGKIVAPRLQGASQTWGVLVGCIGWPMPVTNPPHSAAVQGAPPILLVNSTYDPSTSYVWALGLQEQIADSVLVTREGDGHTSFLQPGATQDAITTYLLTGETPPPGTRYAD